MNEKDSARISTLVTGAIKTTADSTIKSMIATIDAAEAKISDLQEMVNIAAEKTREMRVVIEKYADNFTRATGVLADSASSHVTACQAVIDLFQDHHLKILNVDAPAQPNGGENPNHERLLSDMQKLHDMSSREDR